MASFRVIRPNKKVLFPKGVQEELLLYIAKTGPSSVYGTHTALNRSLSSIQTAMKRLDEMGFIVFSGKSAGERGQTRRLFSLTLQGFCITLLVIEHQVTTGTTRDEVAAEMTDTLLTEWGSLTPVTAEWGTLLSRIEFESAISGEKILEKVRDWFSTAAAFAAGSASEAETKDEPIASDVNVFTDAFCSELMRATKSPRNQEWIALLMTIAAEKMPLFYGVVDVTFTAEMERLLLEAEGLGSFLVAQP